MQTETALASILNNKKQSDPLFSPKEAAEYLGVSRGTLAVWRCTGRYQIKFVKVGRLAKYRKSVLDAFLDRRTQGGEG